MRRNARPASITQTISVYVIRGTQRVMIAMALACNPKLLIADEPTTALDVTIQAQIMRLLLELRSEFGMSILLITHDMGLVAQMADRVLVMYAGQIVEEATAEALFSHPSHPYTHALLASVPSIHDEESRLLTAIPGTVPEQYQTLNGCRFFSRCPYRIRSCERRRQWHALMRSSDPMPAGTCELHRRSRSGRWRRRNACAAHANEAANGDSSSSCR